MLEDLLHDGDDAPAGFISGVLPFQWAQVVNIKRIAMRALLRAQRQAAPEPIEHNNIWRGRSLLQSVEALSKAL